VSESLAARPAVDDSLVVDLALPSSGFRKDCPAMMHRVPKLSVSLAIACALVPACGDDAPTQASSDTGSSDSTGATTLTTADTTVGTTITTGVDGSSGDTTATDSSSSATDGSGSVGETTTGGVDGSSTEGSTSGSDSTGGTTGTADTTGDSSSGGGSVCGDGMIEAPEDCDGVDLANQTCMGVGFDGGTLACDAVTCEYDTAQCVNFMCGDMMINGNEECEGNDLGMTTCVDLMFDGGVLACAMNCSFDTTGCFECGDGTLNGAEECDTNDFGMATCVGEGFDGGMLACSNACALDTTGCFECGDGVMNGMEECDGMDLDMETCETQGYFAGMLACDAACTFDLSDCTNCGNAAIDAGEDCDGANLGGDTCLTLGAGYTGGSLSCDATCGFDESSCTSFALPGPGEVVISEIMQNPETVADGSGGEWFELHNPGNVTLQLQGCQISSANDVPFDIAVDLEIGPGEYLAFAASSMAGPGFVPDFSYPAAFVLNNTVDSLTVTCNGMQVDTVTYDDGAAFPDPAGASMTLDSATLTGVANDNGFNWCVSVQNYNGDFGTPGGDNEACGAPEVDIDDCRLVSPLSIQDAPDTQHTVYGRLFSAGLTDQSTGNDPSTSVLGYVGYGPDGTNPAVDPGWVWTQGMPNAVWDGMAAGEPDNDEYLATLTVPMVLGLYDYAFRFSGDGGTTFTYCDSNGGVYGVVNAGSLNAVPTPVPDDLLISEYVEGTFNNKAIEIYNMALAPYDITGCTLRVYSDGSGQPSQVALPAGVVAAGDVHVICHAGGDVNTLLPLCDQTDGELNFTGNDVVELRCSNGMSNVSVDYIGQVGPAANPGEGNGWGIAPTTTVNATLRRNCNVTMGDTNGGDIFLPALEWTGFAVNTYGGLGTRGCP
jgi:hypothetical protein